MNELIAGLMARCGIDRQKAESVFSYLMENAAKLPEWLGKSELAKSLAEKIPAGLADKIPPSIAEKLPPSINSLLKK